MYLYNMHMILGLYNMDVLGSVSKGDVNWDLQWPDEWLEILLQNTSTAFIHVYLQMTSNLRRTTQILIMKSFGRHLFWNEIIRNFSFFRTHGCDIPLTAMDAGFIRQGSIVHNLLLTFKKWISWWLITHWLVLATQGQCLSPNFLPW